MAGRPPVYVDSNLVQVVKRCRVVTDTMRSRAFIVVVVVVASWMLAGLLLAVDPLDAPFLADSDPDAVCAAAIHYQPAPASAAAAQAATSPTIRADDTSYKPGQPLRGS